MSYNLATHTQKNSYLNLKIKYPTILYAHVPRSDI